MYAIRRKKSGSWMKGINHKVAVQSANRIIVDKEMPMLFFNKELARLEMVENHLSPHAYDIVEIEVREKSAG